MKSTLQSRRNNLFLEVIVRDKSSNFNSFQITICNFIKSFDATVRAEIVLILEIVKQKFNEGRISQADCITQRLIGGQSSVFPSYIPAFRIRLYFNDCPPISIRQPSKVTNLTTHSLIKISVHGV
jgi:hypothetical protein